MKPQTTGFTEVDPFALLSPHKQCAHIRETDRTLGGFIKVLEIIDRSPKLFSIEQGCPAVATSYTAAYYGSGGKSLGRLIDDWTQWEDTECMGCIGSLLAWFFDVRGNVGIPNRRRMEQGRCFVEGVRALNRHLGLPGKCKPLAEGPDSLHQGMLANILTDIIRDMAPDWAGPCSPFSNGDWPVKPALVFKELQEQFPSK